MLRKQGICGLLLGLFLVQWAGADIRSLPSSYDYVYGDPITHRGRFEYNLHDRLGTDGHTAWELYACPSAFECLAGGPMRFSIPNSSNTKWEAFGEQFEVIGSRSIRMFGQEVSANLIMSTQPAGQTYYLYSKDRGLLGFGAAGIKDAPFFWLEGRCGFAARNCK
jgi:hypothetical protein